MNENSDKIIDIIKLQKKIFCNIYNKDFYDKDFLEIRIDSNSDNIVKSYWYYRYINVTIVLKI